MPHEMVQYDIHEVQAIAHSAGTHVQHIFRVINGEGKTKSKLIAERVSHLTGEPWETYMVQEGVRIDAVSQQPKENYEILKVPAIDILYEMLNVERKLLGRCET